MTITKEYTSMTLHTGLSSTGASRKPRCPLPSGLVLNGKWEIIEHIASGGKGDVYRAHQKNLERNVALKVISPDFLDDQEGDMALEEERFRREVQAMAQIRHPNVLQVFDYDIADVEGKKIEYIVMEYLPNSTLRSVMPLEGIGYSRQAVARWITDYFLPVLEGIESVHKSGIVHRDIKPENILMDGVIPKVADFGLAQMPQKQGLTQSYDVLGTIFYMPKEQFEDGASVDARADVYSLGRILYEAITGKITNAKKNIFKQVGLVPLQSTDTAAVFFSQLDLIIRQATAEEPQQRTPSVLELRTSLHSLAIDALDEKAQQRSERFFPIRKRFYFAVIAILIPVALLTIYHFYGPPSSLNGRHPHPDATPAQSSITSDAENKGSKPDAGKAKDQKTHLVVSTLTEIDGARLQMVAGGEAEWQPDHTSQELSRETIPAYYIETNPVSNSRYISFLNDIVSQISVRDSAVYFQDTVLVLLGEVREGYTPILYQEGKFIISAPQYGERPVVRVTAEGALAYAHYYNRDLPTPAQWSLAIKVGQMAGLADGFAEWGYEQGQSMMKFFSLASPPAGAPMCPIVRQKWESLPDLGFRTVRPLAQLEARP